ncbi:Uncharacterised protein [Moraxella equi]|uniref:Uncharacterized protein n=1 Tax=Moraxella equi TaxID=60442 RepID=A0A378QRY1_9GAMM|nr:Uncharacterised protein [Moraxella equi]
MKKLNLILLEKKYRWIFLPILSALMLMSYIVITSLLYDTNFYIYNRTGKDIF